MSHETPATSRNPWRAGSASPLSLATAKKPAPSPLPLVVASRQVWTSLGKPERLALIVWLILLVGIGLRAGIAPHRHSVYPIFADAARHWRSGADLYTNIQEPYRYSPVIAAFFDPLSRLPDGLGGVAWRYLGAVLYLVGLTWCVRRVFPAASGRHTLALLLLLTAPFALGNLNNGQANIHVIGLLMIAAASVCTERLTLAAACLAAAVLLKLYPISVALLFLLVQPRLAPRLLLALAAGLLLPFVLQEPDYVVSQYRGWLHHLGENDRHQLPHAFRYRDLRLLSDRFGFPLGDRPYAIVEVLSGLTIALYALLQRRAGADRGTLLSHLLALGCIWMTLLGPATESATYMLLAPLGAWLLLATWKVGWSPRVLMGGGFALLILSQAAPITPWGRLFHSHGPQPLGALLLLLGFVLTLAQREPRIRNSALPMTTS